MAVIKFRLYSYNLGAVWLLRHANTKSARLFHTAEKHYFDLSGWLICFLFLMVEWFKSEEEILVFYLIVLQKNF